MSTPPSAHTPANESASAQPLALLVDDEPELRDLLGEYFTRHGFRVALAENAAVARELVGQARPDVALLDINMPGENGLSLARWLREAHPQVAILMVTTVGDSLDRILGLEMGADDYIAKPFELRELLARARAVLRRTQLYGAATPVAPASSGGTKATASLPKDAVRFGDCLLHTEARKLLAADGAEIDITAAEFDLLALFASQPNRPLSRDQIMEQAHKRGWDVFDRSIDLRMMRLRRKIERNPDKPEVLKTVRGVGYVFVSGPSERTTA